MHCIFRIKNFSNVSRTPPFARPINHDQAAFVVGIEFFHEGFVHAQAGVKGSVIQGPDHVDVIVENNGLYFIAPFLIGIDDHDDHIRVDSGKIRQRAHFQTVDDIVHKLHLLDNGPDGSHGLILFDVIRFVGTAAFFIIGQRRKAGGQAAPGAGGQPGRGFQVFSLPGQTPIVQ